MRGLDITQEALFSTVHLETFVPKNHPLRPIRVMFNDALKRISGLMDSMYSDMGPLSIPPERLLRASLLQVLYSIRSERQLAEQIQYNLLFRWFIGMSIDEEVWHHSSFSKNRDRLLSHEIIPELFTEVVEQARRKKLLSGDHFSADGTLVQAWASQKSFRPKDEDDHQDGGGRNESRDFHGEKRCNATHESKTDKDARLYKKAEGAESRMCFMGHTLMENRHGFIVDAEISVADGTAERETTLCLLDKLEGRHRKTLGADKNYDTADFVKRCREKNITPHVARNDRRKGGSAIDGRTSRHEGYDVSMKIRKRIEEGFGWGKTIGQIRQVKVRGINKVNAVFKMTFIGWNLTRMRNIQESYA